MEVYEVMFFALPLWFGLVGFLFTLVFGKDIIVFLKSKGTALKTATRSNQPLLETNEQWHEPYPQQTRSRKESRELVLK